MSLQQPDQGLLLAVGPIYQRIYQRKLDEHELQRKSIFQSQSEASLLELVTAVIDQNTVNMHSNSALRQFIHYFATGLIHQSAKVSLCCFKLIQLAIQNAALNGLAQNLTWLLQPSLGIVAGLSCVARYGQGRQAGFFMSALSDCSKLLQIIVKALGEKQAVQFLARIQNGLLVSLSSSDKRKAVQLIERLNEKPSFAILDLYSVLIEGQEQTEKFVQLLKKQIYSENCLGLSSLVLLVGLSNRPSDKFLHLLNQFIVQKGIISHNNWLASALPHLGNIKALTPALLARGKNLKAEYELLALIQILEGCLYKGQLDEESLKGALQLYIESMSQSPWHFAVASHAFRTAVKQVFLDEPTRQHLIAKILAVVKQQIGPERQVETKVMLKIVKLLQKRVQKQSCNMKGIQLIRRLREEVKEKQARRQQDLRRKAEEHSKKQKHIEDFIEQQKILQGWGQVKNILLRPFDSAIEVKVPVLPDQRLEEQRALWAQQEVLRVHEPLIARLFLTLSRKNCKLEQAGDCLQPQRLHFELACSRVPISKDQFMSLVVKKKKIAGDGPQKHGIGFQCFKLILIDLGLLEQARLGTPGSPLQPLLLIMAQKHKLPVSQCPSTVYEAIPSQIGLLSVNSSYYICFALLSDLMRQLFSTSSFEFCLAEIDFGRQPNPETVPPSQSASRLLKSRKRLENQTHTIQTPKLPVDSGPVLMNTPTNRQIFKYFVARNQDHRIRLAQELKVRAEESKRKQFEEQRSFRSLQGKVLYQAKKNKTQQFASQSQVLGLVSDEKVLQLFNERHALLKNSFLGWCRQNSQHICDSLQLKPLLALLTQSDIIPSFTTAKQVIKISNLLFARAIKSRLIDFQEFKQIILRIAYNYRTPFDYDLLKQLIAAINPPQIFNSVLIQPKPLKKKNSSRPQRASRREVIKPQIIHKTNISVHEVQSQAQLYQQIPGQFSKRSLRIPKQLQLQPSFSVLKQSQFKHIKILHLPQFEKPSLQQHHNNQKHKPLEKQLKQRPVSKPTKGQPTELSKSKILKPIPALSKRQLQAQFQRYQPIFTSKSIQAQFSHYIPVMSLKSTQAQFQLYIPTFQRRSIEAYFEQCIPIVKKNVAQAFFSQILVKSQTKRKLQAQFVKGYMRTQNKTQKKMPKSQAKIKAQPPKSKAALKTQKQIIPKQLEKIVIAQVKKATLQPLQPIKKFEMSQIFFDTIHIPQGKAFENSSDSKFQRIQSKVKPNLVQVFQVVKYQQLLVSCHQLAQQKQFIPAPNHQKTGIAPLDENSELLSTSLIEVREQSNELMQTSQIQQLTICPQHSQNLKLPNSQNQQTIGLLEIYRPADIGVQQINKQKLDSRQAIQLQGELFVKAQNQKSRYFLAEQQQQQNLVQRYVKLNEKIRQIKIDQEESEKSSASLNHYANQTHSSSPVELTTSFSAQGRPNQQCFYAVGVWNMGVLQANEGDYLYVQRQEQQAMSLFPGLR